ncbi:unnamed protein product [Paramecium sonneborni]|uniref:Uncharacterized protein n=1 Tax=Paramecium sonneborni TaxID=65129 RepID=A0A8S1Q1N9_9CILI|nr:unnamed protein product [Paramecium sonneborni]
MLSQQCQNFIQLIENGLSYYGSLILSWQDNQFFKIMLFYIKIINLEDLKLMILQIILKNFELRNLINYLNFYLFKRNMTEKYYLFISSIKID